jgi:anaerobic magnesium-protoporphyrin IX monomethyl ester cyclase
VKKQGTILFVEPPPTARWRVGHSTSTAGRRHPSLNVTGEQVYSYLNLSAAAVLRQQGFPVSYIHCQTMGVDLNRLTNEVERLGPSMVVIQAEHINLGVAKRVAEVAEEAGAISVFVGPLATALDEEFASEKYCNFVVRGEWDLTVTRLASTVANGGDEAKVDGLTFLRDNKLVRTPEAELIADLNSLPFPAYDLIDLSKFYESVFIRFPAATMITSRGCPYHCVFCAFPNTIYSHTFRAMSPERTVAEVKYLVQQFGVRQIRFDDDTFEIDRHRALNICGLLKKERLDLIWLAQCRPALMDGEISRTFREAGCVMVLFGIESGNENILKKVKKKTTVEEIRRGVRCAQEAGLEILNCIMLGFYWDTPETLKQSLNLAFQLNAEFTQFSIPTPLPGTEYYDFLKERGHLDFERWEDLDSFHQTRLKFPNLSAEQINGTIRWAYRHYYTRPRYLAKMAKRSLKSKDHLRQSVRLATAYFSRLKEGWL